MSDHKTAMKLDEPFRIKCLREDIYELISCPYIIHKYSFTLYSLSDEMMSASA